MMMTKRRKRRSDRNHVVYCVTAPDGARYVGITVQVSTPLQSVKRRWLKHVNRALCEAHDWGLCVSIRKWGAAVFQLEVLDKVRGKATAHEREVYWIQSLAPELNTARTGKKGN
jgi:predicted GIY-YIG superfamily endonuclease